jgi:uncharacterized protein YbjT (DUF2867 family)
MNGIRENMKKTNFVLAGTGKPGRRVLERLTGLSLPVRGGSRSGELPFDWEDQTTWGPVLRKVESVYLREKLLRNFTTQRMFT